MVSVKFVYGNYRADVWFYSFLMLLRNLITAFVPALAPNNPGIQLAIMTQSLIFSLGVHCYLWPWHMPLCNVMDFVSLSCVLSLAVLAASFLPRSEDEGFFVTVTEIVMLVAIGGGFLVSAVSFMLMTPMSKKNAKLADLGVQLHLMGNAPDVDTCADLLKETTTRMVKRNKEHVKATYKELDAYDKRHLVMFSTFLETEFATAAVAQARLSRVSSADMGRLDSPGSKGSGSGKPKRMSRIKSVPGAEASEGAEGEKLEMITV